LLAAVLAAVFAVLLMAFEPADSAVSRRPRGGESDVTMPRPQPHRDAGNRKSSAAARLYYGVIWLINTVNST